MSRVAFVVRITSGGCTAFTVPSSGIVTWLSDRISRRKRLELGVGGHRTRRRCSVRRSMPIFPQASPTLERLREELTLEWRTVGSL